MILTALLIGTGLLVGTGLVVAFWNDIVSWIREAVQKVTEKLKIALQGFRVFVRKIQEGIQEISKLYSKNKENKWQETIITKPISESEVPAEIRAKARMSEDTDITHDLEMQLRSA